MIVCFRVALILLVVTTEASQTVAAEESSYTATQYGELQAATSHVLIDIGAKNAESGREQDTLRFRRNGQFYSWNGSCYTHDLYQNWYQIDARLC
jgi:hypothetical protein